MQRRPSHDSDAERYSLERQKLRNELESSKEPPPAFPSSQLSYHDNIRDKPAPYDHRNEAENVKENTPFYGSSQQTYRVGSESNKEPSYAAYPPAQKYRFELETEKEPPPAFFPSHVTVSHIPERFVLV